MQSGLVELFDQLSGLREQLELMPEIESESTPRVLPLFSDVSTKSKPSVDDTAPASEDVPLEVVDNPDAEDVENEDTEESSSEETIISDATSSASAKVSRVLDPIAEELKTGEAGANIVLEFLETARDYLIDDDPRKEKVARDIDIVLRFLKARGERSIRPDERENILKRMDRWKAHLVAYAGSPVA